MTCAETRAYVFAFLDDELDARLSMDLQSHLDRCHDCAREVEIERAIRKALAGAVQESAGSVAFGDAAYRRMVGGSWRQAAWALWVRRRPWTWAAGVVVLVAVGWGLRAASRSRPAVTVTNGHLAQLLVEDFERLGQKGNPVQLAAADAAEVATWLRRETQLNVALRSLDGHRCKLIGARKCKLAGQTVAWVVYDMAGVPVVLMATANKNLGPAVAERATAGDAALWISRYRGHTVVGREAPDLLYAAVARLPEDQLVHFVESVIDAGD